MSELITKAAAPGLLEVHNASLLVPEFRQDQRKLLGNPWRIIGNIFLQKGERQFVTLLEKIDFTLAQGGRIGLIGANGAGKSTLLRLLAGVYKPTSGTVSAHGTIRGLFDLSIGMQPLASGMENIYLRGLQMGMTLDEIRERVPEILEFSELHDHIGKPVGTYSAGMRLRLSLAVATMIAPDILLLDEWIGTGDTHFKHKISSHMENLVETTSGLVLATHNAGLMKRFCHSALVLDQGRVVFDGLIDDAQAYYEQNLVAGRPYRENTIDED